MENTALEGTALYVFTALFGLLNEKYFHRDAIHSLSIL